MTAVGHGTGTVTIRLQKDRRGMKGDVISRWSSFDSIYSAGSGL